MSQWDNISNKNKKKLADVARKAMFKITRNVIKRSPVDTGRFRSNWFASIDIPSSAIDAAAIDADKIIESVDFGQIYYLVNNLPYALALEFGHSKQAPAGMVRVSIADFQNEVARNARSIQND